MKGKPPEPNDILSVLVRRRMRELGFTQTQLGKVAGLSQSTVSHILRRSRKAYSVSTLRKVAQALSLDIAAVLQAQEREANLLEDLKNLDRELAATGDQLNNQPIDVKRQAVIYLRRLLSRSET